MKNMIVLICIVAYLICGCSKTDSTDCNIEGFKIDSVLDHKVQTVKVPLRFMSVNANESLNQDIEQSVNFLNWSCPAIKFDVVEISKIEGFDIYYQDINLGFDVRELQENNYDEAVNIYIIPNDTVRYAGVLGQVEGFSQATVNLWGLCYTNEQYREGEVEHDSDLTYNDPNTIYLSVDGLKNHKTLTHEIGHYFNLKHCSGTCYDDRMSSTFNHCDVPFKKEQLDTIFTFLKYRECVVYDIDEFYDED